MGNQSTVTVCMLSEVGENVLLIANDLMTQRKGKPLHSKTSSVAFDAPISSPIFRVFFLRSFSLSKGVFSVLMLNFMS